MSWCYLQMYCYYIPKFIIKDAITVEMLQNTDMMKCKKMKTTYSVSKHSQEDQQDVFNAAK